MSNRKIETLPLHLGLALTNWMTCGSVWQLAKDGLPGWNPDEALKNPPISPKNPSPSQKNPKPNRKKQAMAAADALDSLQSLLHQLEPPGKAKPKPSSAQLKGSKRCRDIPSPRTRGEESVTASDNEEIIFADYLSLLRNPGFMHAIEGEAQVRAVRMLEGLADYEDVQIEVENSYHEVVWQKGNARLLDYGGDEDAIAVLCIPSLINKHYILDLYPERSLIAYLADEGFRPFVLDWGEPGVREKRYDCADYVHYVAREALRHVRLSHNGPIQVLGYCMGAVFALALAQLEPDMVERLILLAAPWDYHSADMPQLPLDAEGLQNYKQLLLSQDTVPPVWTQTLFHLINPWHFQEKFSRFTQMSEKERYHFVAVEGWVNDGVPLARHVAKECFIDWPHANRLASKHWRVSGVTIDPARVTCPVFLAIPTQDRIVPQGCAQGLADALPDATVVSPESGHVSMVVGTRAKRDLWKPMVKWMSE